MILAVLVILVAAGVLGLLAVNADAYLSRAAQTEFASERPAP